MKKLFNLAWYFQLLVFVVFGVMLFGAVWYFYTSGIRTETADLEAQVETLRAKNAVAQVATQRISEFRSTFAAKTAEYDELKVLLPEQREITTVLQGLQDTAQGSRLTLRRFTPRDDAQQDFITAKPVEVEVDSNFNNLRDFYEKMAKLQRIVSITDFKINQLSNQTADKTLHSQFLLTAYYASSESAVKTPAPGQPAANGQPAPAAQTVPPAQPPAK